MKLHCMGKKENVGTFVGSCCGRVCTKLGHDGIMFGSFLFFVLLGFVFIQFGDNLLAMLRSLFDYLWTCWGSFFVGGDMRRKPWHK